MTVGDLTGLLATISRFSDKQVGSELNDLIEVLRPLDQRSIRELRDILKHHDSESDNGIRRPERHRRIADPERISAAISVLQTLYTDAIKPGFQFETLNAEIERLDKELSKDESHEVAKEFKIPASVRSKTGILEQIGRLIADRKTMHDRARDIERPFPSEGVRNEIVNPV